MILEEKNTTLAYRCPACGSVPTSLVGAFSLSGNLFKLKCPCGGSTLTVEKLPEDKMKITVPCLTCPKDHQYTLSKEVFFGSPIFVIPCAFSGIDLCFIGQKEEVAEAVERANEELLQMLGDTPMEKLKNERVEHNQTDMQVFDIITYVVSELASEHKIHCHCKEGEQHVTCTVFDDFVSVRCEKCEASLTIPADSVMTANEFLHCEELTLK